MSSLITPLIESNRSNAALAFWVFVSFTLVLSLKNVPDFSSIENIIGILFITLLITAILSSIGFTNWVKKKVSGLNFNEEDWVGKDQKLLQTPAFHQLVDNNTSSLFFGSGLIFLGVLILLVGSELVISIFGEDYALEGYEAYIPLIIGLFSIIVGVFLFISVIRFKTRDQNEKFSWELILLSRIRKIPETSRNKNEYKQELLQKIKLHIKERDFFALDEDLEASLFNQIQEKTITYLKNLKDVRSSFLENPSKLIDNGYPDLTLDIGSIDKYNSFDSGLLTRTSYDSQGLVNQLKYPEIEKIKVFELMFTRRSEIITSAKQVEELAMQLQAIDILFFRYTSFFITALNEDILPLLGTLRPSDIMIKEGYFSSEIFLHYSIFFSKCLLTYSGFDPQKVKPINIMVRDGKVKKNYKDIFIQKDLLGKIGSEANKDFFPILEKSKIKPFSNRSETTLEQLKQDIQAINDIINKEYDHFMIFQSLFNDIIFFLENGSYKNLFERFIEIRKEIMNSFEQKLENLLNILTRKMKNAPWRNYLEWDEIQFKFVEKRFESQGRLSNLIAMFSRKNNDG